MRRRVALVLAAVTLVTAGCRLDDDAEPDRDPASAQETLPEDAGDLENPSEVVTPGGGSGETEDDGDDATSEPTGAGATATEE